MKSQQWVNDIAKKWADRVAASETLSVHQYNEVFKALVGVIWEVLKECRKHVE